jgi:hypothetical protein
MEDDPLRLRSVAGAGKKMWTRSPLLLLLLLLLLLQQLLLAPPRVARVRHSWGAGRRCVVAPPPCTGAWRAPKAEGRASQWLACVGRQRTAKNAKGPHLRA